MAPGPRFRSLVGEALIPVAALVGVLIAGVVGFVVLAGVGVIEAAFWLLDPTSLELHFENHAGPERLTKAYALIVFAGIVLASLWTGETVVDAAFGGRISEEVKRVQNERKIANLSNHVVICGYGMFGRTVSNRALEAGRDVVVIEQNTEELERAPEELLTLVGDARTEETLRAAGVDRAGALVCAIDDSNANIQIAITASQLAPECRLVVRVGDEMYEPTARRAGADYVVIPEVVSGDEVSELL